MKETPMEICERVLDEFDKRLKYWGRYIDEFASSYVLLDGDERKNMSAQTSSKVKFWFMCQVLGEADRSFAKSNVEKQRELASRAFILMAFENFEFDYRESILLYENFLQLRNVAEDVLLSEWRKLNYLMPERMVKFFLANNWPPKK